VHVFQPKGNSALLYSICTILSKDDEMKNLMHVVSVIRYLGMKLELWRAIMVTSYLVW